MNINFDGKGHGVNPAGKEFTRVNKGVIKSEDGTTYSLSKKQTSREIEITSSKGHTATADYGRNEKGGLKISNVSWKA